MADMETKTAEHRVQGRCFSAVWGWAEVGVPRSEGLWLVAMVEEVLMLKPLFVQVRCSQHVLGTSVGSVDDRCRATSHAGKVDLEM